MIVKFNPKLFWDYEVTENILESEAGLIFYLSRVLNNGNFNDVKEIPLDLIKKYLDKLNLSRRVRKFWEWYLRE